MIKKILLILVVLPLLSCRTESESEGQLLFQVGPNNQYILPINMQTCKEQRENDDSFGVSKNSLQFNRVAFQWLGGNPLEVMYIRIHLESPDLAAGKYTCYISDAELEDTLWPESKSVAGGDQTAQVAGCAIRCGGINFKDNVNQSYITGEATIFAVETTSDGELLPVRARTDVTVRYEKD